MVIARKKRKKRDDMCIGSVQAAQPACWVWMALISAISLTLPAAVVGAEIPGVVTTSSYSSGVLCGASQSERCISAASCDQNGVCQCPPGTRGDGQFQCYPANSIVTEVFGFQPRLWTFHNTSVGIPYPCRYRLTEFTTTRYSNNRKCHFQIFGSNQIIGGRVAMTGFEVHLELSSDSPTSPGIGIRKSGKVKNGVFTYTEWGKNVFTQEAPETDTTMFPEYVDGGSGSGDGPFIDEEGGEVYEWGPPEELDMGGGQRVTCEVDNDNFATVYLPDCGVDIRFRAPDVNAPPEQQKSGLSVAISQDQVQFENAQEYLAETPDIDILVTSSKLKNIRVELEVLHRAMTYAAKQYSTPEGAECEDTGRTYKLYCNDEAKSIAALTTCSIFLENADLVSCMDPAEGGSTSNSLNAYKLCIWNSCSPSKTVCKLLKTRIQQRGCMVHTPSESDYRTC